MKGERFGERGERRWTEIEREREREGGGGRERERERERERDFLCMGDGATNV